MQQDVCVFDIQLWTFWLRSELMCYELLFQRRT